MGNHLCTQQNPIIPKTVTYLPNSIAQDYKYKAIDSQSIRLCDITAYKSERNTYIFTMTMRNQIDIRQCIPVLNQMVHCIGCQNYQLKIEPRMLIDIFDQKFTSTLIDVRNEKTMNEYSMKIVPFSSYNSIKFKKAFYELYLNKQLGLKSSSNVKLLDYHIYGLNPDQQAFVFLFEKCTTSLANIAEYRKQGCIPWTEKQKIKIIYEIFESYESLYNKNIIHRDLRPSNIFYVPNSGRFVIGNLWRARLLRRNYEHDLMSVCGVPDFSCQQMQMLMKQGDHIGHYEGIRQDYCGLKSILNIIETCEIYDNNPGFRERQISNLVNMLNTNVDFRKIMVQIQRMVTANRIDKYSEIGDREIADSCSFLLSHTHNATIQKYMFEAYGYLGYHKDYSNKAHKMLQKNNENGKQYQNALILRNLGDFYESKGSRGTQYYYNAFVLYILRADNQIRYGYPDRAEAQLTNAQQAYFKFNRIIESQLSRIQINRVSALIQLQNGNLSSAVKTINETFVKAAQNNIPVEKQCRIIMAYGKIYKRSPETRDQALKKLEIGLTICENSGVFESPASCRVYKSKFLRQIGELYVEQIQYRKDLRRREPRENDLQLKAQAESHLRSALQIQQRQTVDDMEVADTLQSLGRFYYFQQNFYDAKRYYDTAKIRFAHIKQFVNPKRQVMILYMRGSCCYYLKQFTQARMDYQTCLAKLQQLPKTADNHVLAYNIQGNLGLTLLNLGNPDGRNIIEAALSQIKQLRGQKSYDYVSLYQHYYSITNT